MAPELRLELVFKRLKASEPRTPLCCRGWCPLNHHKASRAESPLQSGSRSTSLHGLCSPSSDGDSGARFCSAEKSLTRELCPPFPKRILASSSHFSAGFCFSFLPGSVTAPFPHVPALHSTFTSGFEQLPGTLEERWQEGNQRLSRFEEFRALGRESANPCTSQ